MKKINREKYREGIINWVSSSDPRYHLTIIFQAYTNEKSSRNALDKLLIHLNKAVYKNRYKTGKSQLRGIASRERGSLMERSTRALMHADHYHLIIFDEGHHLPDYESFSNKIHKQILHVNKIIEGTHIRGYKLQDYYNDGNDDLEWYVTKGFEKKYRDDDYVTDSIGIFGRGSDNVEFGRDYFEPKWFADLNHF